MRSGRWSNLVCGNEVWMVGAYESRCNERRKSIMPGIHSSCIQYVNLVWKEFEVGFCGVGRPVSLTSGCGFLCRQVTVLYKLVCSEQRGNPSTFCLAHSLLLFTRRGQEVDVGGGKLCDNSCIDELSVGLPGSRTTLRPFHPLCYTLPCPRLPSILPRVPRCPNGFNVCTEGKWIRGHTLTSWPGGYWDCARFLTLIFTLLDDFHIQ